MGPPEQSKRVITAPDRDLSDKLKIMLIDFEWPEIEALCVLLDAVPEDLDLYLYGSNDDDLDWCLNMVRECDAVLINMLHRGTMELTKGSLISRTNVWCRGEHELDKLYPRNVLDIAQWLDICLSQHRALKGTK
jgi:hypothetical protein